MLIAKPYPRPLCRKPHPPVPLSTGHVAARETLQLDDCLSPLPPVTTTPFKQINTQMMQGLLILVLLCYTDFNRVTTTDTSGHLEPCDNFPTASRKGPSERRYLVHYTWHAARHQYYNGSHAVSARLRCVWRTGLAALCGVKTLRNAWVYSDMRSITGHRGYGIHTFKNLARSVRGSRSMPVTKDRAK